MRFFFFFSLAVETAGVISYEPYWTLHKGSGGVGGSLGCGGVGGCGCISVGGVGSGVGGTGGERIAGAVTGN